MIEWPEDFFKSVELSEEGVLVKAQKSWVKPSGKKRGYWRQTREGQKAREKGKKTLEQLSAEVEKRAKGEEESEERESKAKKILAKPKVKLSKV